ncbi:MAG: hypothetical protein JOY95_04045 [Silvibacterium sp.]|nr:hypothetical protein [Silvibacterium sp.]
MELTPDGELGMPEAFWIVQLVNGRVNAKNMRKKFAIRFNNKKNRMPKGMRCPN